SASGASIHSGSRRRWERKPAGADTLMNTRSTGLARLLALAWIAALVVVIEFEDLVRPLEQLLSIGGVLGQLRSADDRRPVVGRRHDLFRGGDDVLDVVGFGAGHPFHAVDVRAEGLVALGVILRAGRAPDLLDAGVHALEGAVDEGVGAFAQAFADRLGLLV